MASGIPTTAKARFLKGEFLASHTYKMAAMQTAWAPTAATANWTNSNEASGAGYSSRGVTLSGYQVVESSTKAVLDWTTDPAFSNVTIAFQYLVIFDEDHANDGILGWYDVGAQSVTGTTVNVTFPVADSVTGLYRLA